MTFALLLRYWRWAAGAAILAALAFAWYSHGLSRYHAGERAVRAEWLADTNERNAATEQAIAEARAREDAAKANNTEVMNDANAKLTAIAADRDGLARRLHDYADSLRRVTTAETPDHPDAVAGAGVASGPAEAALDDYDQACRRDAVRFAALQAEVSGQIQ